MQEHSGISFFLAPLTPSPIPPPYYTVFSFPSTFCSSILSFALQVVALLLAPLPAIVAGERLPIFVHTPAVAPPPAFGRTALQKKHEEEKTKKFSLPLVRFHRTKGTPTGVISKIIAHRALTSTSSLGGVKKVAEDLSL